MAAGQQQFWGGSLHQSFRILPASSPSLRVFLESDGLTPDQVLARLPYDQARSGDAARKLPDPKRYRDGRQIYQTVGLLYEDKDGILRVTALGRATLRWLDIITPKNVVVLGRHAAYALSACQLRNPTGAGGRYDKVFEVFPFAFIWKAMIALEGKISSAELNRAIFKVRNEPELKQAIEQIAESRQKGDITLLGPETILGKSKDDRIIPWMSLASFGWTLISDKRAGAGEGYYEIPPSTFNLVKQASQVIHRHRNYESTQEYFERLVSAAALPQDLR